jgi:hypothetical protein
MTVNGSDYALFYNWLVGATMTEPCQMQASNNSVWSCTFTKPQGYHAEAIWSTTKPPGGLTTVSVPPPFAQYRDLVKNIAAKAEQSPHPPFTIFGVSTSSQSPAVWFRMAGFCAVALISPATNFPHCTWGNLANSSQVWTQLLQFQGQGQRQGRYNGKRLGTPSRSWSKSFGI